jgi:hypothetical protein
MMSVSTPFTKSTGLLIALLAFTACSQQESAATAVGQLSTPSSYVITGTGTSTVNSTTYLFATSAGTIDLSNNTVIANFSDPFLPLGVYSGYAYSASMLSGSCGSIAPMLTTASGSQVSAQVSATGCTDQSIMVIRLDTTQVYDDDGLTGTDTVPMNATIDVAPIVSAAATGNSAVDGTGTTEGSAAYFTIASDNSLVVTFSKSLTGGTLTATLTGCSAILGTPSLVPSSFGRTVAWGLSGFSGFSPGNTCTLNVSTVADAAGNPDDPSDTNVSTIITFH